jgi:hypothetical protein
MKLLFNPNAQFRSCVKPNGKKRIQRDRYREKRRKKKKNWDKKGYKEK